MLLASSYQLWAKSVTDKPINFTRFVISMQMTEGLNASRSQIRVVLAPEAKVSLQNVKKGGEWQLLWGYSSKTFRKASAYWSGTTWNIGGSNTVEITLVNLGQYSLTRGTATRSIGQSLTAMAKTKGVELKGAVNPKGKIVPKVQSQVALKEILRDNRESFVKYGFDTSATAEVVAFASLAQSAQIHYISTSVGYIGELKITYQAQLPKDQSYIEIAGKGLVQEKGPGLPTPQVPKNQIVAANQPDPKKDSSDTFGLFSFHVQDLQGKTLRSYQALRNPSEGTSMLKLFIGLAIREQVSKGQISVSQQWQGKTIAQHLTEALGENSSNLSANALISRLGGIRPLNSIIKSLGFTLTGLKTVYGVSTPASEKIPLLESQSSKYRTEAIAAGYLEPYGESPQKALNPQLLKALAKMRQASGLPLKIVSGFRSVTDQESIWLSKPVQTRAAFSAPPGYSQHHTGLAVDLVTVSTPTNLEQVELTWLANNAQKYGFIFPYLNSSGDLGPELEPWHLVWVGNAAAMAVFHDFIARSKTLGYNPLNAEQESLFNSPAALEEDKETCAFDLCNALASVLKGTDPVSVIMQKALDGPFIGLDGETKAKAGFTSKNIGVTLLIDNKYILCAYATGSSRSNLERSVKALSRSIIIDQ
jgi:LAS superfamily LD-carboxypeptidase LdcB